jgi:site-specific recombinase XerD
MNTPTGISTTDFRRFVNDYCTLRLRMNHRPSSVLASRKDLGVFTQFCRQYHIRTITGKRIVEFFNYAADQRHNGSGAINRKRASLCMYLKHLRLRQVPGADKLPIADIPRARQAYQGPIKILEPKEVERILNSFDTASVLGYRDFTIFLLIYSLGLRLGEVLGIDLDHLDWRENTLLINGKGGRQRTLPLPEKTEDFIRKWLKYRQALNNSSTNPALFLSQWGKRLSQRVVQENIKQITASGTFSMSKITPHTFRHAFASHALEGEHDLVVLKAILGHASMKSTEIYLHPSIRLQRQAVNNHLASDMLAQMRHRNLGIFRIRSRNSERKIA